MPLAPRAASSLVLCDMDVIAVLTPLRTIFPVVHQEEHWTVPGPRCSGIAV